MLDFRSEESRGNLAVGWGQRLVSVGSAKERRPKIVWNGNHSYIQIDAISTLI